MEVPTLGSAVRSGGVDAAAIRETAGFAFFFSPQ